MRITLFLAATLLAAATIAMAEDRPAVIGFHPAHYDAAGALMPWTTWEDALSREMAFYLRAPVDAHGYPAHVFMTFMDGEYQTSRLDTIPCTQNGLGIISYLKYWEFTRRTDPRVLTMARKMGDYLVRESLTPARGAYPRFTRSTGFCIDFPLTKSSQGDLRYGVNVIEPDKGGIAGYALVKLYDATGDRRYWRQALRNARDLVKNMRPGDAARAPWPFRVDAVTGEAWGERNADMVYILRLFDALLAHGRREFQTPRDELWHWIKTCQIPGPEDPAKCPWVNFFEDYDLPDNRVSWAPLETARYLLEQKDTLDPDWRADAEALIQFALRNVSSPAPGGVTLMGEQDDDHDPWGGACSKLGGVAALYFAATGDSRYEAIARANLTWMTYFIDSDGCPAQKATLGRARRGGWQEDCHTDVVHNFVDALIAMPGPPPTSGLG